jgi:hypothetical protein
MPKTYISFKPQRPVENFGSCGYRGNARVTPDGGGDSEYQVVKLRDGDQDKFKNA